MTKVEKYLGLAHKLSLESTAKNQKMASVVVRGGNIISFGINLGYRHAETRALRPHMDLEGCDIYVMRANKLCSRPCIDCQQKLIKAGIKRAYYVSRDGNIVRENF